MAFLLPNLEQGVISEKWDPTKSSWEREPYLKTTRLSVFICPSDSVEHTNARADCNYVPNVGWPRTTSGPDGTLPVPTPTNLTPMNGMTSVPNYGGDVRFGDVTDGLSNTICFSERLKHSGPTTDAPLFPDKRTVFHGGNDISVVMGKTMPEQVEVCRSLTTRQSGYTRSLGQNWYDATWQYTPTFTCLMPPNTRSCLFGSPSSASVPNGVLYFTGDRGITPSSEHTGGVNVLMGDGAVRFVRDGIDLRTWWESGGRNDGMVVGDF